MKRWITPIALFILLSVLPLWASATEGSTTGTCGDHATWSYDAQSATLTISGQGAIRDNAQDEFTHLHGVIRTVVIEDGITSIGTNALHNLASAFEVVLPTSVKHIGTRGLPGTQYSFHNGTLIHISDLEHWLSIDFQENFSNSVGIHLVVNGEVLSEVHIPDGTTKIPEWAFANNQGLGTITIPDSVTEIGGYAFFNSRSLRSVEMGNGVTKLGKGAFRGCQALETITLSPNLTYVGDEAFYECQKLKLPDIPDTLTYIGYRAFYFCHGILEFRWPTGTVNIPDEVFSGCKSLTKLYIPATVTYVGKRIICNNKSNACVVIFEGSPPLFNDLAFNEFRGTAIYSGGKGWKKSYLVNYGGEVIWHRDPNSPEDVYVPPTSWRVENGTLYISGSGIMDIGGDPSVIWAEYKDTIKAVEISEGILNVGYGAFYQFAALERVKLPEGLQSIGQNAFMECMKLTQINLPESLKEIGPDAFRYCASLPEIHLPDGLEVLDHCAFYGCQKLQSITIPEGIDKIDLSVFRDCDGLTSIVLHENITYIGEHAFENCSNLKTVEIQGPVTEIARRAFARCTSLEKIVIPASVKKIGNEFLQGTSQIKEIYFEGDMPKIGENPFTHGMITYTLYYPKGNPTWDEDFLAALVKQYRPRLTVVAMEMESDQPPATEPSVTEPPTTEPSATVPPTEPVDIQPTEPKAPIWPYIFGGASVVIVLAILAWIWVKRRGKVS